jgi:hypothetical protein
MNNQSIECDICYASSNDEDVVSRKCLNGCKSCICDNCYSKLDKCPLCRKSLMYAIECSSSNVKVFDFLHYFNRKIPKFSSFENYTELVKYDGRSNYELYAIRDNDNDVIVIFGEHDLKIYINSRGVKFNISSRLLWHLY